MKTIVRHKISMSSLLDIKQLNINKEIDEKIKKKCNTRHYAQ